MRLFLFLALVAVAGPTQALAQANMREAEGIRISTPGQLGVTAETPTRIPSSRETMNWGRNEREALLPNTAAGRARATAAVARAGLVCTVVEAAVIGRARDGGPLIEVDCVEGGGVIIADSDPIQVTDCLDLAPDTGQAGRRQRVVTACRLPGNIGLVERSQSARN